MSFERRVVNLLLHVLAMLLVPAVLAEEAPEKRPCCRSACALKHFKMVPALAAFLGRLGNESVADLGSVVPLTRAHLQAQVTHVGLHKLCDEAAVSGLAESDWVVSLGAAEHLRPRCLGSFFQAMQKSRKGVILAWGLSRHAAAATPCCPASSPRGGARGAAVSSMMESLNWRRENFGANASVAFQLGRQVGADRAAAGADAATSDVAEGLDDGSAGPVMEVHVYRRRVPRAEQAMLHGTNPRCKGSAADGTFQLGAARPWGMWPLKDHFLDLGVARCAERLVGNGSIIDVGGGSGQYGAYFHIRTAPLGEPRLHVLGNLTVVPPGGPTGRAPSAWMIVDGTPGIENYTRTHGPPGSLTTQVNLCDGSLRLPVHDWVMSLEVGEHLPTWCLANYFSLLHRSNRKGIILSWSAIQAGTCHINSKGPTTISNAIHALGSYVMDRGSQCQAVLPWMRRVHVFRRVPEAVAVGAAVWDEHELRARNERELDACPP